VAEPAWTTGAVTASDGYSLGFRLYLSSNPKGPVVGCVHGIQSHSGWYDRSCRYLAEAGFTTYFFDRRGSGINTADRGHARGFRILLDDFRRCLSMMREAHPQSPVIVQAISWGGKIAAATLADHPTLADGLMLVAPGFMPKVRPPLMDQIRIALSTFLNPRRMLPVPLSDPALFTSNPERMRFIANDPVAVKEATARLLFSSRSLDFRLRRVATRIQQPTLLVLASGDRIIDNDKTLEFVKRFSTTDLEVVELKGSHTLEFEPDPTEFFETLRGWIEKRFLGGDG
jgi:alpha-beta hydrolase superfamily lysophospholipase